jgi:LysM repeat protein
LTTLTVHARGGAGFPAGATLHPSGRRRLLVIALVVAACSPAPPIGGPTGTPAGGTPAASGQTATPIAPPVTIAPSLPVEATPSPIPTAQVYIVQAGDSLSGIAERFGLTLGQILVANPDITDPNQIRAGDPIIIPPPDAPTGLPQIANVADATGDVLDADGQVTFAPGYVDLDAVGARIDASGLTVEIRGVATPPALDVEIEEVTYTVHVDLDTDDEPDLRVEYASTPETGGVYTATFVHLASGDSLTGELFPGSVVVVSRSIRIFIDRVALGAARRFGVAARIQREFYPAGRTDPEVEVGIDAVPDQQFPRPNPRWLEVGIGG